MKVRFIHSISEVDAPRWNALVGSDYPFLRHEFLLALEHTGCTTAQTGWQPLHALLEASEGEPARLVGVLPLFLKTHSMGEYVFDWGWADAYQRHGLDYYPKLLTAVPFTPCGGPRLCLSPAVELQGAVTALQEALQSLCESRGFSSWHVLFPDERLRDCLTAQGHLIRTGCQYQWFNEHFSSFDDYLATFVSRKRKTLRKEREAVAAAGVSIQVLEGADIDEATWREFFGFYASTYRVRGRRPYLTVDFFTMIGRTMPAQLMLVRAVRDGAAIAGALFFKGRDTLYGRYWGCRDEVPCLHFEACYYQGIDYCIRHGLQRMDSGAQGEHKIQRGFAPVATWSTHWVRHPEFRHAIAQFLDEERAHIGAYMEEAAEFLPFKQR